MQRLSLARHDPVCHWPLLQIEASLHAFQLISHQMGKPQDMGSRLFWQSQWHYLVGYKPFLKIIRIKMLWWNRLHGYYTNNLKMAGISWSGGLDIWKAKFTLTKASTGSMIVDWKPIRWITQDWLTKSECKLRTPRKKKCVQLNSNAPVLSYFFLLNLKLNKISMLSQYITQVKIIVFFYHHQKRFISL